MRKYYWYLSGYARKHGRIVLISIVVAILFFSIFIPQIIKLIEAKPRSYVGLVGTYSLENMPEEITRKVSAGLTKVEEDGTVSPSVAERWIIENDGLTYRFVIKKDLVWQDGVPLVSDQLDYNFKDADDIPTPNEIVFQLNEPFVPFPNVVSQPVLRFVNERYLFFFTRKMPIGLGTHRVVDYKLDNNELTQVTIDSNEERIVYRFYPTEDQAVTAFKHGQVDILPDLTTRHDVFDWPSTEVTETLRSDRYTAIFFDNNKPFFDKNIRQALSYALPKAEDDRRAIGPISPDSWVYLESGKSYEFDEERALERMLDTLPPEPLAFELTTSSILLPEAERIQSVWEAFGEKAVEECQSSDKVENKDFCVNAQITITLKVTNFPDLNNYDALLAIQQIPSDPDQYYLWHSKPSTNFTHYENVRIDSLLQKGRTTPEAAERLALYQEFQQFFLEDAPALFLEHVPSYRLERK